MRAWTPEAWADYCSANPARQAKAARDRQLIDESLVPLAGRRLLEAGCGYGRLTPLFVGASHLVVLDAEPGMVRAVCRSVREVRSGIVGDLQALPVRPGTFDVVVCVGVLMHLRQPLEALGQVASAVKPGGRLLISWNNVRSPWAWPMIGWTHRPGALRQQFLGAGPILRRLRTLGFVVYGVRGDALLPLTAAMPGTSHSLWPGWLWRGALRLERWSWGRHLSARFGYELFLVADRMPEVLSSS